VGDISTHLFFRFVISVSRHVTTAVHRWREAALSAVKGSISRMMSVDRVHSIVKNVMALLAQNARTGIT